MLELEELLNRLRAKGVTLSLVDGGFLEAYPASALTAEDREALIRLKPKIVAWLLALPLDRFARDGQPIEAIEVRVSWLDTTLWWVPTEREALRLVADGITRGRIWTARELMQLLSLGLSRVRIRTIAEAQLAWGGGGPPDR